VAVQGKWTSGGLENLLTDTVKLCRPDAVWDGEGVRQEIGETTEIRAAVTLYEGRTVLVFDANEDVRVGDLILAPNITD